MAEETQGGEDELQFEAVESAASGQVVAAPQCAVCKRPIADAYFAAGDKMVCPECRERHEAALRSGSKFGRFSKATLLGSLAGIIGAAIWFGIRQATERDFALVAIGVGLLVGGAVRMGSGGRGGRGYQFLALVLTYLAVGLAFAPDIVIQGIKEYKKTHPSHVQTLASRGGATTAPAARAAGSTQPAQAAANSGGLDDDDTDPAPKAPSGKTLALAVLLLLVAAAGLVLAGPVLVAVSGFPIGTLIVGIGLWEAWKINMSRRLQLAGPYSLAGGAGPPGLRPLPLPNPPIPPGRTR